MVRSDACVVSLVREDVGNWLWTRLQHAFPGALGATLMPNHLHLCAPARAESAARKRLGAVISALRRSRNPGAANRWGRVSSRGFITKARELARHLRYISLNPSRARLVACPLAWRWSTHRDVMGAVIDPWVTPQRLSDVLNLSAEEFAEAFHNYVSSDPSTDVAGTPPPTPHLGHALTYSPAQAMLAAIASVRGAPDAVQRPGAARRIFLAFAQRASWRTSTIAHLCNISPQRIRGYLREKLVIPAAALRCLGDPRLTAYLHPAQPNILRQADPQATRERNHPPQRWIKMG